MKMKLYELYLTNGLSYGDYEFLQYLIVAENEVKANERAQEDLKKEFNYGKPSYTLTEITEVDGYNEGVFQ